MRCGGREPKRGYEAAPTLSPRTVLSQSKVVSPDGDLEGLEPHLPWRSEEMDVQKGYGTGLVSPRAGHTGLHSVLNLVASLFCLAFRAARVVGFMQAEDTPQVTPGK